MGEMDVEAFWSAHPCGDEMMGGLNDHWRRDYQRFFEHYDSEKYAVESHVPRCIAELPIQGKSVLEIGLGQGAESEVIISHGARWTGIDLTKESVDRVRARLQLHGLPYEELRQGSVTSLPWDDSTFDVVFSHGVLHHVADIQAAQKEIRRVLKPDGEAVVMLYARRSLNYLVAIGLLRRAAVLTAYPFRRRVSSASALGRHLSNAERTGLRSYLRMSNFIHANTDGPGNPYAKVYDLKEVRRDFHEFEVTSHSQHFMHAPPLPVHGWPGESVLGWHLWVRLRPR